MVEYGCNVANKFGFMSDDDEFDDPQELISRVAQLEAEKAAAQKKADKLAKQIAATPKEAAKPAGERGGRGGRGRGRGGVPRTARQEGEFADRFGESRGTRGFRGMRGRERRGRSGRGLFNGERRGRRGLRGGRQFDRQSGSVRAGVRGVEKKEGHGRGNWGDDKDELAGETEPLPAVDEPEAPREVPVDELPMESVEVDTQKTLKEFYGSRKKEAPKFNVRKAGEGEEKNMGKLVKLQKEVVVDKEEEEVSIIRREPREKIVHIDIQFAEPNRGYRGERGDRRGDRPPRGRGGTRGGGRGARGGGRGQAPPSFDASLDAFPALGSK
ncbi:unnamed protein product [Angiostrongylus costaricensis]|uniref:HABP4_PAI-RBP1 domain-containing protein n=1 Tax=Angiostrongylus costaricensis TaxID=334426 RepID=A0A0R3PA03_ANGCS|nr:unnamed protein product [Angiostrongylus costaricensis]